jgi:hypothetical protein
LQDIRDPLINDDTALILENNQEYNSKFLNEIKKTGINIKEIENSIDKEFEQKKLILIEEGIRKTESFVGIIKLLLYEVCV